MTDDQPIGNPPEGPRGAPLPEGQPADRDPQGVPPPDDDRAAEDSQGVPLPEDLTAEDPPAPPEDPPAALPSGHDPTGDELAFLERSLADLDAEREAGDISDADYRDLTGLYTDRAAEVRGRAGAESQPDDDTGDHRGGTGERHSATGNRHSATGNRHRGRAGGDRRPGRAAGDRQRGRAGGDRHRRRATRSRRPPRTTRRRWQRPLAILVMVAMLGTGVGVALASALGTRSSSDTVSGDIRQSTRGMLFEAQEFMATGRFDEAEELYAAVVAAQPSSAEALAWWGWLHFQRGDLVAAAERIDEAVTADPRYPDARVFGAIVAFRLGRLDEAAAHLDAFDAVDPPPLMVDLVESSELRQRILAGRLAAAEAAGDTETTAVLLAASSPDEMTIAARYLAGDGEVVLAIRLYGAVLQADPSNVAALVGRGALLTSPDFADFDDLIAEGLGALERAVELAPDNPEARYWRALAAARQARFDDALADLDHLATLDAPEGLLAEAARLAGEIRAAAESS